MNDLARDQKALRKRVAQIIRRAETHPRRGALLLRGDVGELLQDLKRLTRSEPAVVLDVFLFLMERLVGVIGDLEDGPGFASSLVPEITARIRSVMRNDARTGDQQVDHGRAIDRLFKLWIDDAEGFYQELDELLLEVSVTPAAEITLRERLIGHVRSLPLVFPPPRGASDDLRRALLIAERHRCERLLGELLARMEQFEYSVIVASDHYRRTGDAVDLVAGLHRSGKTEDALTAARKALASPRSFQRQRIQELVDGMVCDTELDRDRETLRELERMFTSEPSENTFAALKKAVPPDQWVRVRRRVLGHLQKHQKAPTVLFRLYLDEGEWQEADGLVVVQQVDPDVLRSGAFEISEEHPSIAAGWLLFAAHHRATTRRTSTYPLIVEDLLTVRELASSCDQMPAFERALRRFRTRYSRRRKLMEALDRKGLR